MRNCILLLVTILSNGISVTAQVHTAVTKLQDIYHRSLSVMSEMPDQCLAEMESISKAFGMEELSPVSFFDEVGDSFFENNNCKFDEGVTCNLQNRVYELAPHCSRLGGNTIALNVKVQCGYEEVLKVKNVPLCVGQSCDESMINVMNDMVADMVDGCSIRLIIPHRMDTCFENPTDKFSAVEENGKFKTKSCKWLQERPLAIRQKFCQNNESSALDVCPLTCCACESEKWNLFLKRKQTVPGEDGNMRLVPVPKSCAWLESQGVEVKNRFCSQKRDTTLDGYEPAWKQCPRVCGLCLP